MKNKASGISFCQREKLENPLKKRFKTFKNKKTVVKWESKLKKVFFAVNRI